MTSYLTTSEERDAFLRWLEEHKDEARETKGKDPGVGAARTKIEDYWYFRGVYETYMIVIAHIKTGGKL